MTDYVDQKRVELAETISEAERFVKRAKAALKGFRKEKSAWDGGVSEWWRYDSILYAAAKRASMDLTRALARLRRA